MFLANVSEAARRQLSSSNSINESWLFFAAAAVIALFWLALYWVDHRPARMSPDSAPTLSLFQQLCHAHALTQPEQALLASAAVLTQTEQPALLFVDSRLLNRLAASPSESAAAYARLLQKLFERRD